MHIDSHPEYVVLYATTDCNHRCSHCFLEHNQTWDPKKLERIASILSQKCLVHINGAETLLHPEFLSAYKAAGQRFIFTNGLVFLGSSASSIIELLHKNGITDIRLSRHFQATKTLNAIPEEIVESVTKELICKGFNVHYNTTITEENYLFLPENCAKAYALGVKRIKFFPLKTIGRAKDHSRIKGLDFEQMTHFYKLLTEQRKEYDIDQLSIKVSGDLSGIAEKFTCTFGQHSYAITPDMKVHGCVYSISNIAPIGHLLDDGTIVIDKPITHTCKKCLLPCT